jgi:sec-independent protein translocase protein TatA
MRLGFGEILIVLVVALLIFGPTKLPQLGDALGKAIKNFKKGSLEPDEPEPPKPQPQIGAGTPASPSQQQGETTQRR